MKKFSISLNHITFEGARALGKSRSYAPQHSVALTLSNTSVARIFVDLRYVCMVLVS
jgi:hypothetical protein